MSITPAYCVDEEDLMSLMSLVEDEGNDDDIDQDIEEMLRRCLSLAAKLEDLEVITPEGLAWATGMEATALQTAQTMGALAEDARRELAALALSPGEEAAAEAEAGAEAEAEELRREAALADARRADAEELAAATRRLQEKDLRSLAAAEHLVDPRCLVVVRCMAEVLDSSLAEGCVPTPEEMAAVAVLEGQVVRMRERMDSLADRLRRGAAAFAARPGEEALVGALQRQAAKADAARATAEAFMDSVRRYQDAGGLQPAEAGAENECQDMMII